MSQPVRQSETKALSGWLQRVTVVRRLEGLASVPLCTGLAALVLLPERACFHFGSAGKLVLEGGACRCASLNL